MKKLLFCLILICLTAPGFCLAARAAESGECGLNARYALDSNGVMTISGAGAIDYPFWGDSRIQSVQIGNGITSIGKGIFLRCINLTTVKLPESLTSIGASAFLGCENLLDIQYAGNRLDWEEIDWLEIAGFPENAVVSYGKTPPADITWQLDGNGLLTISGRGRMWNYQADTAPWHERRAEIKRVRIESGVTQIGNYAFMDCMNLTDITIPNSVTRIGARAFQSCDKLISIVIPNSVKNLDYAFEGCFDLTSVTIPASVAVIKANTFKGCMALSDIWYAGSKAEWQEILIADVSLDENGKADGMILKENNHETDAFPNITIHYGREDVGLSVHFRNAGGESVANLDNQRTIRPDISLVDPDAPGGMEIVNLFLAFYDENDMMVSLESWEVDISNPLNIVWLQTLEIPDEAESMTVMVLSDELAPLRAARML